LRMASTEAEAEAEKLINEGEGSKEGWANGERADEEGEASEKYYSDMDEHTGNGYSYSALAKRHGPRLRQLSTRYGLGRRLDQRGVLVLAGAVVVMLGVVGMVRYLFAGGRPGPTFASVSASASTYLLGDRKPFFADFYKDNKATPGTFPLQLPAESHSDFCSICDCHATPTFYSPSPDSKFAPRPLAQDIQPSRHTIDVNEYARKAILDMYCAHVQLTYGQALTLLRNTHRDLGEVASWSLAELELGKPTIYLTTATSPNSNARALRPQYFRRHGKAIQSWISQRNPGWQVVWVVAEDEEVIDPRISRMLRKSEVPYIYFAYGLTRAWGNAQKNAVLQMTYALSNSNSGLLGHGPVYGLDDDNKMLPELLNILTKVTRVGAFPVGNLGYEGWEGPIVDEEGVMIDTESGWKRKFSLDYGAYTFNSSLLGTLITAPALWKHTSYAGESEFLEQIAGNIRHVEPLCSKCRVVWHNEGLTDQEKIPEEF
jgi:hypothetical protein